MTALRTVGWNRALHEEYLRSAALRGKTYPTPAQGVMVVERKGAFVCAVGIFPSDLFILVDNLVTNPGVPLRLRHEAVKLAIAVVMQHAVTTGKVLRLAVTTGGLRRMLLKAGFQEQLAVPMFFANLDLTFSTPEKSPRQPTKSDGGANHIEERTAEDSVPIVAPPVKEGHLGPVKKRNRGKSKHSTLSDPDV